MCELLASCDFLFIFIGLVIWWLWNTVKSLYPVKLTGLWLFVFGKKDTASLILYVTSPNLGKVFLFFVICHLRNTWIIDIAYIIDITPRNIMVCPNLWYLFLFIILVFTFSAIFSSEKAWKIDSTIYKVYLPKKPVSFNTKHIFGQGQKRCLIVMPC